MAVWLYRRYGRLAPRDRFERARKEGSPPPAKKLTPFPLKVAKVAMHCGAGCTVGDIIAETLAVSIPAVAVYACWHTLFAEKMFAVWAIDYLFAFLLASIAPMRGLGPAEGIVAVPGSPVRATGLLAFPDRPCWLQRMQARSQQRAHGARGYTSGPELADAASDCSEF